MAPWPPSSVGPAVLGYDVCATYSICHLWSGTKRRTGSSRYNLQWPDHSSGHAAYNKHLQRQPACPSLQGHNSIHSLQTQDIPRSIWTVWRSRSDGRAAQDSHSQKNLAYYVQWGREETSISRAPSCLQSQKIAAENGNEFMRQIQLKCQSLSELVQHH